MNSIFRLTTALLVSAVTPFISPSYAEQQAVSENLPPVAVLPCSPEAFSGISAPVEIPADAPNSPTLSAVPCNQAPENFSALFNGKDLEGWWGVTNWGKRGNDADPSTYVHLSDDSPELAKKRAATAPDVAKYWRVENGELVNGGNGPYLATSKNYEDFELIAEYKTVPLADSGIYLRGYPQVQIWDSTNKREFKNGAQKGSGALWNNTREGRFPLHKADRPFGEWNRVRVLMAGSRVWVWLNGKPTVCGAVLENYFNRKKPIEKKGPILLQTHGGEIRWRNLFIREIKNSNVILAARNAQEFSSIFNGKNLDGWTGATDAVKIENNSIIWKNKKGGVLYTQKEYSNFVQRFEFKMPPGSNNGLAIRYPGKGDAAYTGTCEVQILDDHYEKVRKERIDPRQAHGSAYGMIAAARGYQRPYGEWNFQETTANGSKIRVELNGFVILDGDLSTVPPKNYMGKRQHPGKDRKSGYFGFTGHNDPVEFRNLSICELP